MEKEALTFSVLRDLQQAVASAPSPAVAADHVASFLREGLDAEDVAVRQGVPPADEPAGVLHIGLGADGYLEIRRRRPFQQEEVACAELAASLLAPPPGRFDLSSVTVANEYLAVASQAVGAMSTSLDLQDTIDNLFAALNDLLELSSAMVVLVEGNDFAFFSDGPLADDSASPGDGPAGSAGVEHLLDRVLAEGEAVVSDGGGEDGEGESWLAVPLLAGPKAIGALMLAHGEAGVFSERELWLASALASHVALVLHNERLNQRIQQQLSELSTLYEASATITENLDRDAVLRAITGEVVRALDPGECAVLVRDRGQRLTPAAYCRRAAPGGDLQTVTSSAEGSFGPWSDLAQHSAIQSALESTEALCLRAGSPLSAEEEALLEVSGLQEMLIAPMVHREQPLGLLILGSADSSRAFDERAVRLARNLAGQAAVAIDHSRLYGQTQHRVDELSAFHEIVLQLNRPLELEVVLQNITEAALRLIEATNLHIYLWDEERDEFTFCSALWRDGRRTPAVVRPRQDGLTATVVHGGQVVVIDDADNHPLYQGPESSEWGVKAIAGFPLRHGDRIIGAFTATYLEPHTFSSDELMFMNLLADQAAVAVENARLFADAQQRLRSMSALVDMAKQVTGNLRVERVMQTTVQTIQKLLNARASTIALLSEDGSELVVEAAAGIKPQYHRVRIKLGEGISGRAVRERRMIYIRDTYREPDFLFFDDVLRSLLVVPLITRDRVIGTLTVDSDRPEAFSDSDRQLLTIAAAQVSVAFSNARLFEALEERAAELARAYEELKENDRLKDELVQNVSHELRTPLTFIRGYVDLLLEGEMGGLTPQQLQALQIVSTKTDEVTRLVEDIMSLQRISAGNLRRERFAISDLLESSVACHEMSAENQGLELIYEPPAKLGIVEADQGRINQVLDNLIGNAMKFSPDGGKIVLRMIERRDDVLVVVSDEGIGIPEDKAERIFERFYQIDGSARRRFGGAGIGLAIVKRIIDAHAGDIWVKSGGEKGSAFFFTLPKTPGGR